MLKKLYLICMPSLLVSVKSKLHMYKFQVTLNYIFPEKSASRHVYRK